MKNKILLVGQNPNKYTGNGLLLQTCLNEIDYEKNDVCVFTIENDSYEHKDIFRKNTAKYNSIYTSKPDIWDKKGLLEILSTQMIDQVLFVGLDIWRYLDIFKEMRILQDRNKFILKALIPYDLNYINTSWLTMMDYFDQVYTYTLNGYNLIKKEYPTIKYFRPDHPYRSLFKELNPNVKKSLQLQTFPKLGDKTLFLFIANNQIRKNVYNTITGFAKAVKQNPNLFLSVHTDDLYQEFNLENIVKRNKLTSENIKITTKKQEPQKLAILYSISDCHVLFSLQEGLSLTVLESKLAGVPSMLSYTSSHKDFTHSSIQQIFPDENHLHPIIIDSVPEYDSCLACSIKTITDAFLLFENNMCAKEIRGYIDDWFVDCHNFNDIINDNDHKEREQIGMLI